tara:strand:+ start:56 stop:1243 length:1188 start_codon:yes stop_codon:yes gene_type:complete
MNISGWQDSSFDEKQIKNSLQYQFIAGEGVFDPKNSSTTAYANALSLNMGKPPNVTVKTYDDSYKLDTKGHAIEGEGSVLRYPASPGIRSDSDYVLCTFYKYLPPAKDKSAVGHKKTVATTEGGLNDKGENVTFKKINKNSMLNVYNHMGMGDGSKSYERTDEKQLMLYMPEDISTGYKANWNGKQLSAAGKRALQAAGADGFGKKIMAAGDMLGQMWDRFGAHWSAGTVRDLISSTTGDTLSDDELLSAIGGVVTNPNTELLFGNIDMRTFSLKWKLVPRNQAEADSIKGIVLAFKKAMLPGTGVKQVFGISAGDGVEAGYISVPDLVKIAFMHGPEPADYLPQFKMCAITQVDVNYTPDGAYAIYQDGPVAATELTVNFQETKLVYREEVQHY